MRPLPCRSFRLWPNAAAGREGGSVFSYSFSTARSQPPRQGEWRPWVALPSSASKIAGQSRFVPPDRMACVPQPRKSPAACPPQAGILLRKTAPASGRGLLARCMRAFCFAKPRLSPAGVCLPAASGHFASQSRACLRQGSACPLQAGILLRKTAPASGRGLLARCKRTFCFAKSRLSPAGACLPAASGHFASQNRACLRQGLPARCMRAFCFAKPRLPPAGVCLPAACGHFASQNRRTPYFQKINAAVYVEPPSGEKAPLHGPGQGGSSLFLICR